MASLDWKASVSFSDRFASFTRIQAACATVNTGTPASEHQKEAKRLENHAFGLARSKADYDAAIRTHVSQLECVPMKGCAFEDAETGYFLQKLLPGGATIGNYVNAQPHRDGLFSTVFKAQAKSHSLRASSGNGEGIVALKVTRPSAMSPPHDSRREERLLGRAKSDHVVPLLETFCQAGDKLILSFPFLPFELGEMLRRNRLQVEQRKIILRDLLNGLAHVHSLGIIHRDIKPSNILAKTPCGPFYIADFGIAWAADDPSSEPGTEKILDVGTTAYRAPELLFGNQAYDATIDMWAAGCVAAQVTGLGPRTLFDSGDLGSDLALIKSIFSTLGTPNDSTWPEAANFHDWGKMAFYEYPRKRWTEILPKATDEARDFVAGLVTYESKERITAEKALQHPYLLRSETKVKDGANFKVVM